MWAMFRITVEESEILCIPGTSNCLLPWHAEMFNGTYYVLGIEDSSKKIRGGRVSFEPVARYSGFIIDVTNPSVNTSNEWKSVNCSANNYGITTGLVIGTGLTIGFVAIVTAAILGGYTLYNKVRGQ